ncbi:ComF family protein [Polaribacter tangerinus]|uniref:ComF family protein n=1 Tax=Polaribacter tangerinus TaxID=1920034 RepID=UPI000B4A873F|nr:ComF family protein [Polaribacter tangerinus]
MNIISDFLLLFYPKLCACCKKQLVENELIICTFCRHDMPLANFKNGIDNKVFTIFKGRIPIEKAFSLLIYRKEGITKKLIQELKYKGNEEIGEVFGDWIGKLLKKSNEFKEIDYVISVPLHTKKLKKRGYNQVDKLAINISKQLNIPFVKKVLVRANKTKTQTLKMRFERFKNLETTFKLTNNSYFKNKHILIVDDIVTTGATLEACAKELQKTPNVKISIATIAYTE